MDAGLNWQLNLNSHKIQVMELDDEKELTEDYYNNCDDINDTLLPTDQITYSEFQAIFRGTKLFFFNYQFMRWLSCILNKSFTYLEPQEDGSPLLVQTQYQRIHRAIDELLLIGVESAEGSAFRVTLENIRNFMIIKTPQVNSPDYLYHEYFVGIWALKNLRRVIPNFMYVYGIFNCSSVVNNYNFCDADQAYNGTVNYLMSENIQGESLQNMLSALTGVEILSYIYQIVTALNLALYNYDFTHYDLHTGNVLMRAIGHLWPKIVVPIIWPNREPIFIETNFIPTIIDYGRCHVKVTVTGNKEDLRDFGYLRFPEYFNGLESNPAHDLYKLLGFMAFYLHLNKSKNRNIIYQLLKFFPFVNEENEVVEKMVRSKIKKAKALNVSEERIVEAVFDTFIERERKGLFEIRNRWPESRGPNKLSFYNSFVGYMLSIFPNIIKLYRARDLPKDAKIISCTLGNDVNRVNCPTPSTYVNGKSSEITNLEDEEEESDQMSSSLY